MPPTSLGLNKGPRVALIYATGTITSGRGGYDPMNGATVGSSTLIDAIRQARRDPAVRAIVLRIDSPGGSAAASDAIWRELMIARTERADLPIVASMSDLAASGGYFIALPAEVIVAQLYPGDSVGHSTRDIAFSPDGKRIAWQVVERRKARLLVWSVEDGKLIAAMTGTAFVSGKPLEE